MGSLKRNLKALHDIIDNTTTLSLMKVSSIRKLIENNIFHIQVDFIYDKYKNKIINNSEVENIINFTYYDVLPEEFWVRYNNNGKLTKIQPATCIMNFPDNINIENDILQSMISDFNELINFYNTDMNNFKTKFDRYYDNDKYIGFYIYTNIDINQ